MYINGVLVGSWSRKESFMLLVVHRFGFSRLVSRVVHSLYGTCHKCGGRWCSGCGGSLPVEPVIASVSLVGC